MKGITMRAIDWQKSSFSNEEAGCVELATTPDRTLAIRESDYPDTVLTTTPHRLRALLHGVRTSAFNQLTTD